MKVLLVVGARPNFVKIAPVIREMEKRPQTYKNLLVHTGQHYDDNMHQIFFDELELAQPGISLDVGIGTHAWQTAQVMLRFEPIAVDYKPDWVLVVGGVDSTLACTLVCAKLGIKVAHIEAGLRSFDRTQPEEINRVLIDQTADILFTPTSDADDNLMLEGIDSEKIHFVGNIIIDTLVRLLPKAKQRWPQLRKKFNLGHYLLVTLNRSANIDDTQTLSEILQALAKVSRTIPVLFPVRAKTHQRITDNNLLPKSGNLNFVEPFGYLDFLALQAHATLVLTDSGEVQEETTYLGISCLTIGRNTAHSITMTMGTNKLVPSEHKALIQAVQATLADFIDPSTYRRPELWDGGTAGRILDVLAQ